MGRVSGGGRGEDDGRRATGDGRRATGEEYTVERGGTLTPVVLRPSIVVILRRSRRICFSLGYKQILRFAQDDKCLLDSTCTPDEAYSSPSEDRLIKRSPVVWLTLALAATLGCRDPLSSDTLPTGTFNLVLVDGVPLPFRGSTSSIVRGQLVLATRAEYTLTQTDSAHAGSGITEFRSSGSWSLNENAIVLHHNGDKPIYLGVITPSDTARLILNGHTNTYLKQ